MTYGRESRSAAPGVRPHEDPVDLLVRPLLGLRVTGEEVEGEAEGRRGRLVARDEEDEDLLTQFGGAETSVLGALRLGEEREEVLSVTGGTAGLPALGDDPVADLVQRLVDGGGPAVAGVGQARGVFSGEKPRRST